MHSDSRNDSVAAHVVVSISTWLLQRKLRVDDLFAWKWTSQKIWMSTSKLIAGNGQTIPQNITGSIRILSNLTDLRVLNQTLCLFHPTNCNVSDVKTSVVELGCVFWSQSAVTKNGYIGLESYQIGTDMWYL